MGKENYENLYNVNIQRGVYNEDPLMIYYRVNNIKKEEITDNDYMNLFEEALKKVSPEHYEDKKLSKDTFELVMNSIYQNNLALVYDMGTQNEIYSVFRSFDDIIKQDEDITNRIAKIILKDNDKKYQLLDLKETKMVYNKKVETTEDEKIEDYSNVIDKEKIRKDVKKESTQFLITKGLEDYVDNNFLKNGDSVDAMKGKTDDEIKHAFHMMKTAYVNHYNKGIFTRLISFVTGRKEVRYINKIKEGLVKAGYDRATIDEYLEHSYTNEDAEIDGIINDHYADKINVYGEFEKKFEVFDNTAKEIIEEKAVDSQKIFNNATKEEIETDFDKYDIENNQKQNEFDEMLNNEIDKKIIENFDEACKQEESIDNNDFISEEDKQKIESAIQEQFEENLDFSLNENTDVEYGDDFVDENDVQDLNNELNNFEN